MRVAGQVIHGSNTAANPAGSSAITARSGRRDDCAGPPVRQSLPEPIELVWRREIDLGNVFDLLLHLEDAAEG